MLARLQKLGEVFQLKQLQTFETVTSSVDVSS
jgi:hypothetical protein